MFLWGLLISKLDMQICWMNMVGVDARDLKPETIGPASHFCISVRVISLEWSHVHTKCSCGIYEYPYMKSRCLVMS